ncbi:hypothetical protein T492DRAFT_1047123 [Pavlovales sp. CCMP2436]|nr:hypothetical protein T492DRAFT_1047123 [Pavlovales sp. CCMP2436]|mmetsp:Transcript_23721/g.56148  ORF Transcript_23721/g.56148 Transcript_23721/m.56148 type:complete len:235 (+) Transcript_23721:757-1461(+)
MPLREQATALCFDVLFVLLGRGVLAEDSGGARSGDGARGFGAMLPFLPRMLAAPSALMQRATVAGVSRLCWHASKDARFEAAVIGVMEDECFLDECLLQLVLRYVDTSSRAEVQGAASRATAGPSARRTVLTAEDNCEIIKDIDHALSCLDEGVIADAAVYVVVAALSNEAIDPRTAEGFGAHDSHKRRALHELVRRLASPELRAQLAESVGSTSADLFSFAPDPSHVRAWLQL